MIGAGFWVSLGATMVTAVQLWFSLPSTERPKSPNLSVCELDHDLLSKFNIHTEEGFRRWLEEVQRVLDECRRYIDSFTEAEPRYPASDRPLAAPASEPSGHHP